MPASQFLGRQLQSDRATARKILRAAEATDAGSSLSSGVASEHPYHRSANMLQRKKRQVAVQERAMVSLSDQSRGAMLGANTASPAGSRSIISGSGVCISLVFVFIGRLSAPPEGRVQLLQPITAG